MEYTYSSIKEPDSQMLSELLMSAIGPRTMKEFAKECGVSAAALTKIKRQYNKGPSSIKVLQAIAGHADPKSGVTLDDLIIANGMANIGGRCDLVSFYSDLERNVDDIIISDLFARGVTIRMCEEQRSIPNLALHFWTICKDEKFLWNIKTKLHSAVTEAEAIVDRPFKAELGEMILGRDKNAEHATRYSIVYIREDAYRYLVERYGKASLPIDLSLIYIDASRRVVMDEFVFRQDNKPIRESIFGTMQRLY